MKKSIKKPKIVVFDYGFGNVRSACRAFEHIGAEVLLTADFDEATRADGLVVPGVGAFAACMKGLIDARGDEIIKHRIKSQAPVLGICVGHQVLFERGVENAGAEGLGILSGVVEELPTPTLPHMGWNTIEPSDNLPQIFKDVEDERFYYVHSFAVLGIPSESDTKCAYTEHEGTKFISAVSNGIITGTQFHPEKSGEAGLHLLRNWIA